MLLIFRIRSTEDPEVINKIIQRVLHKKLKNAVGPPKVHPELVEIKSKFFVILFTSLTQKTFMLNLDTGFNFLDVL